MKDELIKRLKRVVIPKSVPIGRGIVSSFYIDTSKAYGDPVTLSLMCDMLWDIMDKGTTVIAGYKYGGLPLAVGLSLRHGLRLTMVRPEVREHDARNKIDGYRPTIEDKVALVNNMAIPEGTFRKMTWAILPTGATIVGCYAIIRRTELDPRLDLPVGYLLDANELRPET